MKKILKRILSAQQYARLARLYTNSLKLLTSAIIKVLPDLALHIQATEIDIKRKWDYERCDILLCLDHAGRSSACKKEPETVEWIENFLKEGNVLYDIGANIGVYSLVACKFFNSRIKVYAFEPAFPTFPLLCKNILLNNCQESIIPLPIALSDKTTIDSFNYWSLTDGSPGHAFGEAIDYKGDVFEPVCKQYVLGYRIDDLVKQFNIPPPNHMKIDIDGKELSVLKGAEETLSRPSVSSILLELQEGREEANQIIEFLAKKGFEVYSKHSYDQHMWVHNPSAAPTKIYNYIFKKSL